MDSLTIHAYSPKLIVGDCHYNAEKILECMDNARSGKADVALFPELSLTSCSCGDLFGHKTLLDGALRELLRLTVAVSEMGLTAVVGLPFFDGGKIYNCAAVIHPDGALSIIPKKNGRRRRGIAFDFADSAGANRTVFLFSKQAAFSENYTFAARGFELTVVVGDELAARPSGNMIILNPSAAVETAEAYKRQRRAAAEASGSKGAVITLNPSYYESTTDYVFSGYAVASANGTIIAEKPPFSADYLSVTFPYFCEGEAPELKEPTEFSLALPFIPVTGAADYCEYVLNIQSYALARRMEHIGSKKLVIGVSGGLDSALALLVCCHAADILGLKRTKVIAVSIPALGSSERTKNNAERLSKALGAGFRVIDVSEEVLLHLKAIGHDGVTADSAYENAQARERTQVLMDLANLTGGLQIGTGDLSELALGFTTYGGDHLSMYGVNASVPKTLVKALVMHCGAVAGGELREIAMDIAETPISPELLPAAKNGPAQKTEEIVGPYEIHDFVIWHMFVNQSGPAEIFDLAKKAFAGTYEANAIVKCMKEFYKRFFAQQFKRSAMPEGPAATRVSLSPRGGFSMPGDMAAAEWLREADEIDAVP